MTEKLVKKINRALLISFTVFMVSLYFYSEYYFIAHGQAGDASGIFTIFLMALYVALSVIVLLMLIFNDLFKFILPSVVILIVSISRLFMFNFYDDIDMLAKSFVIGLISNGDQVEAGVAKIYYRYYRHPVFDFIVMTKDDIPADYASVEDEVRLSLERDNDFRAASQCSRSRINHLAFGMKNFRFFCE